MQPLRLIQVGMGGWGRSWAKVLALHPELVEVVACVDVEPQMLMQLRDEVGVDAGICFPSLDAALAAGKADAVLITTPVGGHAPAALAALTAGMHVLVEKPFATSLVEAQEVVEAAADAGKVLMVSQNYRFYPAAQTAAALVRQGALGPVSGASVQFRRYANLAPRESNRHYHIRHPLLMDMAIHHFDLMRYVLGQEPQSVHCHAWNPPWSNFTEPPAAVATIVLDGGAVVDYRGSWVSTGAQTTWDGEWQIECAGGVIAWTGRDDNSLQADAVTLRPRGKRPSRVALPDLKYWDRAGSLAEFVDAVRSGREPLTSGRDNLASAALMFAAMESAETGRPITTLGTLSV
ncbi:MAG: Gfo/Idh/MocA family oxidoreductase [Caldilineaceae bacterium]